MVKVGLLHSLSGTMAASEAPIIDAAQLAIAEMNAQGGVLGEPIEAVVADGGSYDRNFIVAAQHLLEAGITTLFGCWTSSSRKSIRPLLAQYNALLWYPVQYEGLEEDAHIIYGGACPNQQLERALGWLLEQGRRRLFIVGSEYVFPLTAGRLLASQLQYEGGELVGEVYVPLGCQDFGAVIEAIATAQPTVIFNTLNGDSNRGFYQQLAAAALPDVPVMAVSITETDLADMGAAAAGHWLCNSYFQCVREPANQTFVEAFQARYGRDRVTTAPLEATYTHLKLWQQAVEAAGSFDPMAVRAAAVGQTVAAPSGHVTIEANHHIKRHCYIAQVQPNTQPERLPQLRIIWQSPQQIRPLPWLGVEESTFRNPITLRNLLAEVPDWIQTSMQLKQEIRDREAAEAALAAAKAEIEALNAQLTQDNQRMVAELDVARQLQRMILPKAAELAEIHDLDIAGFMQPADEVGGDYYDVLHQEGGFTTIGIGDVTGHGLESGILMLMTQTAIRTLQAAQETDLVKCLNAINTVIYRNRQRMGSYRNLTLSLLDYRQGQLTICGQHEEVLLVRAPGHVERIDTLELGFHVGMLEDISQFVSLYHVQLEIGDGIVLYTDGITEAENNGRKLYGLERLIQQIEQGWSSTATTLRRQIIIDLKAHIAEHVVYDDITLVIFKRLA